MVGCRPWPWGPGLLVLSWLLALPAGAQDLTPDLSGRIDTSWNWTGAGSPGQGQTLGLVTGSAGLTAGTREVKTDLRLGLTNLPGPAVSLDRAWVKFRLPGVRFTGGLGRLAWGPGFVLVPGDLLFDAVGTGLDWQADELRSEPAWVADAWLSLGEEAFAEAAFRTGAGGLRLSAAPFGVTLEAAGVWDRNSEVFKAAASTQFHLGLDWYATLRADAPETGGESTLTSSAGAFGLWDLAGWGTLSTRHEALVPSAGPWDRLRTYHDAFLTFDGVWTIGSRVLWDAGTACLVPQTELRWTGIQSLRLYLSAVWSEPRILRIGSVAVW